MMQRRKGKKRRERRKGNKGEEESKGEEKRGKERKEEESKGKESWPTSLGSALKATAHCCDIKAAARATTCIQYANAHIHFACVPHLHFKHTRICISNTFN